MADKELFGTRGLSHWLFAPDFLFRKPDVKARQISRLGFAQLVGPSRRRTFKVSAG